MSPLLVSAIMAGLMLLYMQDAESYFEMEDPRDDGIALNPDGTLPEEDKR